VDRTSNVHVLHGGPEPVEGPPPGGITYARGLMLGIGKNLCARADVL